MQCHLCLKDRELVKSHIIPEFLFRPGYDENRQMQVLQQTRPKPRIIQKGFNQRLLCPDCENHIVNQFEDYFARKWYVERVVPNHYSRPILRLNDLDYARFKLFHLSILWRASISTLAPFNQVSLGESEETLREMLLADDPGKPDDFQILAVLVLFPGSTEVLHGMLSSPTSGTLDGQPLFTFLFGGCMWMYFASLGKPHQMFSQVGLSEAGNMILPVREFQAIKPLHSFFTEYVQGRSDEFDS